MGNTILVVDDQSSVRQLLQEYLTEQGYRVVIATDGQNAIYTARHEQPDLILLDIMMPIQDGYETCKRLRARRAMIALWCCSVPCCAKTSAPMPCASALPTTCKSRSPAICWPNI